MNVEQVEADKELKVNNEMQKLDYEKLKSENDPFCGRIEQIEELIGYKHYR